MFPGSCKFSTCCIVLSSPSSLKQPLQLGLTPTLTCYLTPPLDTESHTREGTNTTERYRVLKIYHSEHDKFWGRLGQHIVVQAVIELAHLTLLVSLVVGNNEKSKYQN